SEVIHYSADQLRDVLRRELELEKRKLLQQLHRRTIELIFVAERVYKEIESKRKPETISKAVFAGLSPFKEEIPGEIVQEDVDYLLSIPIRRISAYDIARAKEKLNEIRGRISEIDASLTRLTACALAWIDDILKRYGAFHPRRTEIVDMNQTSVQTAAIRDRSLCYNGNKGYLGYDLEDAPERFKVSVYDRVLILDTKGRYRVIEVPEKLFIGYRMRYIGLVDEDIMQSTVFAALYKNAEGVLYLKRFRITKFILEKKYSILPDDECKLLELSVNGKGGFAVDLEPTARSRRNRIICPFDDYRIKSVQAKGYKITERSVREIHVYDNADSLPDESLPLFE
ncbi:MAG: DNA topoisomerase IV subunit A, partial [Fibrobacterota bacterium]